mgnify:CR=1 FL=1
MNSFGISKKTCCAIVSFKVVFKVNIPILYLFYNLKKTIHAFDTRLVFLLVSEKSLRLLTSFYKEKIRSQIISIKDLPPRAELLY